MSSGTDFVDRFYALLGSGDVDGVVDLYAPDGEIVRYDGVADTRDQIAAYFRGHLGRHPGFSLRSIDQLREADDVLMWDALVDTDHGVLQTMHVVVFTDDGAIHRHIPGLRGYWGQ
ncbi:nuclear transport factor 2 family protein [Ilumatobacter sp.]|uniref:nuclear transport factor 2 family protein n=1 Tax=Ilumatobacter sp. TaxID=1967498 RepID=UPI003AF6E158